MEHHTPGGDLLHALCWPFACKLGFGLLHLPSYPQDHKYRYILADPAKDFPVALLDLELESMIHRNQQHSSFRHACHSRLEGQTSDCRLEVDSRLLGSNVSYNQLERHSDRWRLEGKTNCQCFEGESDYRSPAAGPEEIGGFAIARCALRYGNTHLGAVQCHYWRTLRLSELHLYHGPGIDGHCHIQDTVTYISSNLTANHRNIPPNGDDVHVCQWSLRLHLLRPRSMGPRLWYRAFWWASL